MAKLRQLVRSLVFSRTSLPSSSAGAPLCNHGRAFTSTHHYFAVRRDFTQELGYRHVTTKSSTGTSAAKAEDARFRETGLEDLEKELEDLVKLRPSVKPIRTLLRKILCEHLILPNTRYYEALISGHADGASGRADLVKAILEEMRQQDVSMSASVYQGVLKALAVHPDHRFRSEVLDMMRREWMELAPPSVHLIVAGLIRDGQLELAHLQVLEMLKGHTAPKTWLLSLLMYALVEAEDYEAVLQLMYKMEDERLELSALTWQGILDETSQRLELDITKRLWQLHVEPMYIVPSTGMCYNVLLTATRAGDKKLAKSVRKVLAQRLEVHSKVETELFTDAA